MSKIVCQPFEKIKILKFIIKNFEDKELDDKIILVGPQTQNGIKLLNKLAIDKKLNKTDDILLNKTIPHYKTIFGDLKNYNIIFCFQYLETNMCLEHIRIIIMELIDYYNIRPNYKKNDIIPLNQIIYVKQLNITYHNLVNFVNYIFENKMTISNHKLITKLKEISGFDDEELNNYLDNLEPKNLNLISGEYIDHHYTNLIYNKKLINFFISIPKIITIDYNIDIGSKTFKYLAYNNIEKYLNKLNSSSTVNINSTIYSNNKNTNLYLTLNYYNKTVNNEYYIILKKDIEDKLPKNMINYYLGIVNVDEDNKNINIDNKKILSTYLNFNKYINFIDLCKEKNIINGKGIQCYDIIKENNLNIDKYFKLDENLNRNLIFEIYTDNVNLNSQLNINSVFNNISTNYYLPMIKLYKKGNIYNIKINKTFIQSHNYSVIHKLLINKLHSKIKYIEKLDYLQFKWRIKIDFILTINVFENGHILAYFDNNTYIDINKNVMKYMLIINSIIKKIKKLFNLKYLHLPNLESIFKENKSKITYSNILYSDLIIKGSFKFDLLKTSHDIFVKYFTDNLQKFNQFIILDKNISNIRCLFKQIDMFYHPTNVIQFMNKFMSKNNNKINKSERNNLFKIIKKIFGLSVDYIELLFDKRDEYEMVSNCDFLYGIDINILINSKGLVEIKIDNIDNFHSVSKILYYIRRMVGSSINTILYQKECSVSDIFDKNYSKEYSRSISKSSIKKNSTDKEIKSQNVDSFDFDIDIDIDPDADFNIDIDLENINIEFNENVVETSENQFQNSIEHDLDDISKLIEIEKKDRDDNQFKDIEIKKQNITDNKLKYKEYMKKIRSLYDPELYEIKDENNKIIYSYGDSDCDNRQMRQPYIVTKKELESYDPDSFTGYIKYRKNYYICPRIWDYKQHAPISVKKFIENNYKSPYNQGLPIPPDKRDKTYLDNQYTVVIRKPTTSTYWSDSEKEKKWGKLLKDTGKDAYPGLAKPKNHPNKLCVPCCFKKPGEDYDPNKREIQEMLKPIGYKKCNLSSTDKKQDDATREKTNDINCLNHVDNYILNESIDLDKCKLGKLNNNLNTLLCNHQDLFMDKNNYNLINNANLLLRRGVSINKKYNFLETMSVILNVSLNDLLKNIVNNLDPLTFIKLNNSELIDIYCSSSILPNTENEYDKFKVFLRKYTELLKIFEIDIGFIDKLNSLEISLINNINLNTKEDIKNYKYKTEIKKIIILYKIYTSFYNYISHILNEYDYKNYLHFVDLFSQNIEWLNPNGANIIFFNNDCNKILCNQYLKLDNKNFIFLIKENNFNFIPIVHVLNIKKKIIAQGLVDLNIYSKNESLLKLPNTIKQNISDRYDNIINLITVHSSNCNKTNYEYNLNIIDKLNKFGRTIISQYLISNCNVEIIKLDNNLILPIYPTNISINYGVVDILNYDDLLSLNDYLKIYNSKTDNQLNQFIKKTYKIKSFFINQLTNYINAILFSNNMIIPIKFEKLTTSISNKIKKITDNLEYVMHDFNLDINSKYDKINSNNQIFNDFKYNFFIYEFSRNIQNKEFRQLKKDLNKYLNSKDKFIKYKEYYDKIVNMINSIMNDYVTKKKKEDSKDINLLIKYKSCYKTKKNKCHTQKLCSYDDYNKKCLLDLSKDEYDYYIFLLINDLVNNIYLRNILFEGSYIPKFNINLKIFRNPNEIIINPRELANILHKGIYSKFKTDVKLTNELPINKKISLNLDSKDLDNLLTNKKKYILNRINKLLADLINTNVEVIYTNYNINTTLFDKKGVFNKNMNQGICQFPFSNKDNKLEFNCIPSNRGYMCPTTLNLKRKPTSWGYCPDNNLIENEDDSKEIIAVGDTKKKYISGKCIFPYLEESENDRYKLLYECKNETDENNNSFSWCPVKLAYNEKINKLLKASDKFENIYKKKWKLNKFLIENNNQTIINPKYLTIKKKGYCQPPYDTKKFTLKNKAIADITIDNYNIDKSKLPISKGGYSKLQLFNFGVKYLNIPNNYLKEGDIIIKKEELVNIINKRFRLITKKDNNNIHIKNIYKKNIDNCLEGVVKGGYYKKTLKEMVINYLNVKPNDADNMSKEDLCNMIKNEINISKQVSSHENVLRDKYPGNIAKCRFSPKRGGLSIKTLKKIAKNKFDLDVYEKSKDELCDMIEKKLNEINIEVSESKDDTELDLSKNLSSNKLSSIDSDSDSSYINSDNL